MLPYLTIGYARTQLNDVYLFTWQRVNVDKFVTKENRVKIKKRCTCQRPPSVCPFLVLSFSLRVFILHPPSSHPTRVPCILSNFALVPCSPSQNSRCRRLFAPSNSFLIAPQRVRPFSAPCPLSCQRGSPFHPEPLFNSFAPLCFQRVQQFRLVCLFITDTQQLLACHFVLKMAHTVPADQTNSSRKSEEREICVVEPEQIEEMHRVREALFESRMQPSHRGFLPPSLAIRKRTRTR